MMIYICDRCGKKITRPRNGLRYEVEWGTAEYDEPFGDITVEGINVCESCYGSFLQWKRMYLVEYNNEERE